MDANKNKIIELIKYMNENYKKRISVNELATQLNMSKFYFIRIFKDYVGVTLMQFMHFITLNFAKANLKNSQNLLNVSYELSLDRKSVV